MFFSIIIPTYNRCAFLKKAIESVLSQTYNNFELIIVDDGSTDDTSALVDLFDDQRIVYIKQDNHGVSHARNRGIERACGEFICFLDSDDWFLPHKLERTKIFIDENLDIKIFHTQEVWYQNGKELKQQTKHQKPDGWVYANAVKMCCISISTVAIHRSVFDQVGVFDENLEACEDYDFWLRATSRFEVKLIDEYLTEKEGGRPDQLSSSVWGLDRFRITALGKMLDSDILDDINRQLTRNEFEKKCKIFIKGATKRGNNEVVVYYKELLIKEGREKKGDGSNLSV